MSADIKTFVTHVLQQGFCLGAIQYTHRGTHYERTLHRRHCIGINVKELIMALVTAADAVSVALACFWHWQ